MTPPALLGRSLRETLQGVWVDGRPPVADPEVSYLTQLDHRLAADPGEYVGWLTGLGTARLRTGFSRARLDQLLEELTQLWRTGHLAPYACAEAMQICLADLVLLERMELTAVPATAVDLLRRDLLTASVEVVVRLVRNLLERLPPTAARTAVAAADRVRSLADAAPAEPVPIAAPDEPLLVVITAGRGTRLRTTIPKGLVPVGGTPMVAHVVAAARSAGVRQCAFAVKYRADIHVEYLSQFGQVLVHDRADGTGHTAFLGLSALAAHRGPVVLCYSDTPFLTAASFRHAMDRLAECDTDLVLSTFTPTHGGELGRIIRDERGRVVGVGQPRLGGRATPECDGGLYAFRMTPLLDALRRVRNDNPRREYPFTDVVSIIAQEGRPVAVVSGPAEEFASVNRPADHVLAELRMTIERHGMPDLDDDARRRSIAAFVAGYGASPRGTDPDEFARRADASVGPVLDLSEVRNGNRSLEM